MRPETARGSASTITLWMATAKCVDLLESFTQCHEPRAWCWHLCLLASLATTRLPCGSPGASREQFWVDPSNFCLLCLKRGAATLATASKHHENSPELPRLQQREHRASSAKAKVTPDSWGGYSGSSPLRSLTDNEKLCFLQAIEQHPQDTQPPLLPSLPLDIPQTCREGIRATLCSLLRPKVEDVGVLQISSLATDVAPPPRAACMKPLKAIPAPWLLPTLHCPGSWWDTGTTYPITSCESTPLKVEAQEVKCLDNHIFLVSEVSHALICNYSWQPNTEKAKGRLVFCFTR